MKAVRWEERRVEGASCCERRRRGFDVVVAAVVDVESNDWRGDAGGQENGKSQMRRH